MTHTWSMKHHYFIEATWKLCNYVATSPSLQYLKCYISQKWNLENTCSTFLLWSVFLSSFLCKVRTTTVLASQQIQQIFQNKREERKLVEEGKGGAQHHNTETGRQELAQREFLPKQHLWKEGRLRTKYQDTLDTKNTMFNISSDFKYITCMCTKINTLKVITTQRH